MPFKLNPFTGVIDYYEDKKPREQVVVSGSVLTPNIDIADIFVVTQLSESATISSPIGTPVQGQKLIMRIKDDGVSRGLSWDSVYRANNGSVLPTQTTASETMYLGFIYNSTDAKWDLVT
jgi:hypothetical protein